MEEPTTENPTVQATASQVPQPAVPAPKEEVAGGLPGPVKEFEPEEWTIGAGRKLADERTLIYVNGSDTDDVREFARGISAKLGLLLVDATLLGNEERGAAMERCVQIAKDLKGKIGAVFATAVSFGPSDSGDPQAGVVVAIAPFSQRHKAERTFRAEPDSFVSQPSWQKRLRAK